MRVWFIIFIVSSWLTAPAAQTGTLFFVDLSKVANTAREDDGIANNGRGGWTDEGVNDMLIYPPVATGAVVRNGYRFHLTDPATSGGRDVLMLRGGKRATDKPSSATVAVPSVKARYLYVLQNAAAGLAGQPGNYRVATYTVAYADGTQAKIPVRDGIEIRQWWTGQWWDNSGRAAWPLFMGRNIYSQKWNQYIGLWAMQWENPSPDRPIAALTFHSEGLAVPVIWAVTLADEDFYEPEARRHEFFVRPAEAPAGFFRTKEDIERRFVFEAAAAEGLLQGVRRVDVIRADLLAVTLDGAVGGIGAGDGAGIVERYQRPECFSVTATADAAYRAATHPVRVGRQTSECWRGDIGSFPANTLYKHVFYLALPAPLKAGATYRVRVNGLDAAFARDGELRYDDAQTLTPVIKINQGGYTLAARSRYAYMGWWAADLGTVDYDAYRSFEVIDEADGRTVLTGVPAVRATNDVCSGEAVREMDISGLTKVGRYHIRIPGLGRSDTFAVGGPAVKSLYVDVMRAFFHQRCGQELRPPWTTFRRPACHLAAYESGLLVGNLSYLPKTNEPTRTFRGGYHDAADDDVFAYHLRATAQFLAVFEQHPDAFRDGDLNIPESGNGLPDVLDEADWALSFYRDNQQPDGGVPLGRGNDQDSMRGWQRDHAGKCPPFGIFPPTEMSCTEFAAVAAQFARLIRPYDAARADRYVAAAAAAYRWAAAHPDAAKEDRGQRLFRAWAAGELWATTGEAAYRDDVQALYAEGAFHKVHWKMTHFAPGLWACVASPRKGLDAAMRSDLRQMLLRWADETAARTAANPYRMGHDGRGGLGWGNGNGGGYYADVLLRAWWLTGDRKYLDAASLNADFQLGANPLSMSFITGIGARHPVQPEVNESLYTKPRRTGETVRGITVFGLASGQPPGYPADMPLYRRYRDVGLGAEVCSEFTVTETLGASAMLYAALYAEENR